MDFETQIPEDVRQFLARRRIIRAVQEREFSDGLLQYPLAPAYFLIPLGSGLLCIRLLQDIVKMIRTRTLQEEEENI